MSVSRELHSGEPRPERTQTKEPSCTTPGQTSDYIVFDLANADNLLEPTNAKIQETARVFRPQGSLTARPAGAVLQQS